MRFVTVIFCLFVSSFWIAGCKAGPDTELHRAARMGKLEAITAQLDAGVEVDLDLEGETPLIHAARKNEAKAMALLIEHGAKTDVRDVKGRDLWELIDSHPNSFLSVYQSRSLTVLLDHGFKERISLLDAVRRVDDADLVKKLIDKGADLDATDEYGWTALHRAAHKEHEAACEALIEAGANVNAESTKEWLRLRSSEGNSEYADFRYEVGSRPLDVAAFGGSRGTVSVRTQIEAAGGTKNPKVNNRLDH